MLKYAVRLRYFCIAIAVALVHIATGADILWAGPEVLKPTPLAFLAALVSNHHVLAGTLITAGLLALLPFCSYTALGFFRFLVFPQQVLLFCHLFAAGIAVTIGQYPDGYVPAGGGFFIFADQVWLIMVVLFHTLEYLEA